MNDDIANKLQDMSNDAAALKKETGELVEELRKRSQAIQQHFLAANRAENGAKGLKFDSDKQQWHRLPLVALEPLADVYCKAGKKYPAFNCLLPFENGSERLYDAGMRHTKDSQIDPLAKDPEDDCYHLAKVAFCALTRLHNALYHSEK